jgi:glyoxylase-like metal-dependent hydrolase (beta-lactamase superfamily II)
VLIAGFPAGSFGTNCYVVATGPGQECVVVDPGQDATGGVEQIVAEHGLKPVAVMLTHGHIDHMWSVVPVCGAHDIPAYIHPADRALLSDPAKGLGAAGLALLAGLTFSEPSDVRELGAEPTIVLAGLEFTVDLTPGHTPGSVTFRLGEAALLSGDLLFAGSIGRTDLPGGNYEDMMASLARVVLPLPDELAVLPGHGTATSIGAERATNPYLREAAAGSARSTAPTRGL